jgi:hypothetical protein
MRCGLVIGLLCGSLVLSDAALAAAEPSNALEVDLFAGWARQIAPSVDHAQETWSRNGGLSVQGGFLLRTSYFLSPFVDLGYLQLYAADETRDLGAPLGQVESESSLSALSLSLGPAFDLGRFRARAGMGVYRLRVESTVLERTITPAEYDLGYLLTLSGALWRSGRWSVGIELRAYLIAEAETGGAALGVTGSWDAVRW